MTLRYLLALVAVSWLTWWTPAFAQTAQSVVVITCGTPPVTYTAGLAYPDTQDPNGKKCVNATVSATISVAPVTTTSASGTVTLGGTFQSVLASNAGRNGCTIENPTTATEALYVFFGPNGSATTAKAISLAAGSSVTCAVGGLAVATDNVSVTATTTSHAFVANSQ